MRNTLHGATRRILVIAAVVAIGSSSAPYASAANVSNFGDDGWESTDTRVGGVNATTQPAIDSRLQFVLGPAGSTDGALKLISPTGSDKATLAKVDTNGLGVLAGLSGSYRWYKDSPNGGAPAPALKLGIATSDLGTTPASSRIGENNWDKVLIYEPYDNPDAASTPIGTWVTQTFDASNGTWWMFDRSGGGVVNPPHSSITINDWLSDPTYGTRLTNGSIVDVQLGIGSGNADTVGYVDWLDLNVINGGVRTNFIIPEPSTFVLGGLGLAAVAYYGFGQRRRRNRG